MGCRNSMKKSGVLARQVRERVRVPVDALFFNNFYREFWLLFRVFL